MALIPASVVIRFRTLRGFVAAALGKIAGSASAGSSSTPQRMCPSCGRITPRDGACCLECGKAFNSI